MHSVLLLNLDDGYKGDDFIFIQIILIYSYIHFYAYDLC